MAEGQRNTGREVREKPEECRSLDTKKTGIFPQKKEGSTLLKSTGSSHNMSTEDAHEI